MALSEKKINDILRGIFEGSISLYELPVELYEFTRKKLVKGVREGFGKPSFDLELYNELKSNIYVFSGAKTYTQIKDISSLILDGDKLRPWTEFRDMALQKFEQYNVNYLQSEYQTSIGQAQSAVKWKQIVRDEPPTVLLQRKAVMDDNTSKECELLNNLIAPANHKIWSERSPLTHFRCRCILTVLGDGYKPSSDAQIDAAIKETDSINPLFKGNPGIDKVIFNKSHPYFDIDKKDAEFAKRNFGLPIN